MNDHISPHLDRAALITIDMQCDFALPGAPAEIVGTYEVIPALQRVVAAFRERELPIVHVVRFYSPDGSNADLCRRELIAGGTTFAVPGSPGAELVDELKNRSEMTFDCSALLSGRPQTLGSNEWALFKPRWGAFYSTILESHLRDREVDTLIITGCNFPNCPRATVYEASERDFRIVLVTDAVSGLYERGTKELENIGVNLMTSDELRGRLATSA